MRMGMSLQPTYDLEQHQLYDCPHCGATVSVGNFACTDDVTSEPICSDCKGQLYNSLVESDEIAQVTVRLNLVESQDSSIFILGEAMCSNYTDMLDRAGKIGIDNVEYNGHFGHLVLFDTTPDNLDYAKSVMKRVVNLYVLTVKANEEELGYEDAEKMAAEAVYEFIDEEVGKKSEKE